MIRNYFVVAFRNLLRNKSFTVINVLGLSLGVTAAIIIFLIINYELSFDRFHTKFNSIYRVVQKVDNAGNTDSWPTTPYPFAKAFRNDFPDVPLMTQIDYQMQMLVKSGTEKFMVRNVIFADSLFFKVFDFKVSSGNPQVSLGLPAKVFLSRSLADKLFPEGNYHVLKIHNTLDVEVAGIVEDPPATSHMNFSMIISMPSLSKEFLGGLPTDQWSLTKTGMSYLVLPEHYDVASIELRLREFMKKYSPPEEAARKTYKLQPLDGLHFDRDHTFNPGESVNANWDELILTGAIGVFILIIACINFIHLATAGAINKSREIGIRKTLGARQGQIASYFLGETFILSLFSILISLCITELILDSINQFLEKKLTFDILSNPALILFLFTLLILLTILAGLYPAFVLSRFSPVVVLKNKHSQAKGGGAAVRRGLVVFQFMIAQVLIIATLVIGSQMNYFHSLPLGFDKDAVINVKLPVNDPEILENLRSRLESSHTIKQISFCSGAPTSANNFSTHYYLTEKGIEHLFNGVHTKPVDIYYKDTYGLKLKAGRWFTEADAKVNAFDTTRSRQPFAYIINESCMKQLGFKDPDDILGKHITTGIMDIEGEVVGVVEDFHVMSLHSPLQPVIMLNFPFLYYEAAIKLNGNQIKESIALIEKNWSEIFPDHYFEYEFLDVFLEKQYRNEQRSFALSKIFAGIAIFIGCLGLYGLISFMANDRVKEVGVRKVLGATVGNIIFLFSKEFVKLILIAFVLAFPIAWYFMNQWLQRFQYHISIPWTVFIIGVMSTLAVALVAVGYKAVRAAVANPVDSLRTE